MPELQRAPDERYRRASHASDQECSTERTPVLGVARASTSLEVDSALCASVVLPPARLRQWVLSVPYDLRFILAKNPAALNACGRFFVEEIFRWQRLIGAWCGLVAANDAAKLLRGGAVSFPQRFGGSLNLNVHYHVVVPDTVFYRDAEGHLKSELLPVPSESDLHDVAQSLSVRVLRYLTREGLIADAGSAPEESGGEPSAIEACVQSFVGLGNVAALSGDKVKRVSAHSPRRNECKAQRTKVREGARASTLSAFDSAQSASIASRGHRNRRSRTTCPLLRPSSAQPRAPVRFALRQSRLPAAPPHRQKDAPTWLRPSGVEHGSWKNNLTPREPRTGFNRER